MLEDRQDAFGHFFEAHMTGGPVYEIIERDDGLVEVDYSAGYFSDFKNWRHERKAMRYARGRVLDIGCGAGRHSLYLQDKGHDVLATDNSPLAIEVCRRRGIKNTEVVSINGLSPAMGVFDTVLMLGNNFGLFGSFNGAKRLLKKLHRMTSARGRIIAGTNDVYQTDDPVHLTYQRHNRERGRMSGQIRLRIRFRQYAGPWINYLMVSKEEMETVLEGTGWKVSRYIDSGGSLYVAVIDKVREGRKKRRKRNGTD